MRLFIVYLCESIKLILYFLEYKMYLKNTIYCGVCLYNISNRTDFNKFIQLHAYNNSEHSIFTFDYSFTTQTTLITIHEYDKIAKEYLLLYKYKQIQSNTNRYSIYRIPRTFTIAYNETHLISTSMRANLYYLYWLLECKDIMWVITSHLFNVVKCDYSLYTCANK